MGGRADADLASGRGVAVDADKGRGSWRAFTLQDGVKGLWLDERVTPDMAEIDAQIGTQEIIRAVGVR